MRKWVQTDELKVTCGKVTLRIGDYVQYNDCAGKNGENLYKGKWRVLGADECGNLLIVSENNVAKYCANESKTLEDGMKAYSKGKKILDKICEVYAKGNGAITSRSICVEDVNKITLFKDEDESKYFLYGSVRTYNNKKDHTFIWCDAGEWKYLKTKKEITLTHTLYSYSLKEGTILSKSLAYDMLFSAYENENYWLATPYVGTFDLACFGLHYATEGYIGGHELVYSDGTCGNFECGVRAVVTLKPNTKI